MRILASRAKPGLAIALLLAACSSPGTPNPSTQPSASPQPKTSASPTEANVSQSDRDLAQQLFKLINDYRIANKLPAIPISAKLTQIAEAHAKDLLNYQPQLQKSASGAACDLHSWSTHGSWTPVCYTEDHKESAKMWSKPREIAGYTGNGYEIALEGPTCKDAHCLLELWKNSPAHNQVMLNQDIWTVNHWNALGVGIAGRFVTAWFGEDKD